MDILPTDFFLERVEGKGRDKETLTQRLTASHLGPDQAGDQAYKLGMPYP